MTLSLWAVFVAIIVLVPQSYRAQALIVPAETTGIAASSLLAPLASVSPPLLDQKPSGNFAVYLGALRAREMAIAVRRETWLEAALEVEKSQSWTQKILRLFGFTPRLFDDDEILSWLENNSSATPLPNSIIWRLEVRHRDPALALAILQTLHATAEARVRDEMAAMVARRISWLSERATSEQDQIIRNTLYDMLGQAYRHSLILAADNAVAARIVSAPSVEDRPSIPNRISLAAFSAVASIFLTISFWSLWFIIKNSRVDPEFVGASQPFSYIKNEL